MKRILYLCGILCGAIVLAGSLRADTVVFNNGEELDGTVLEKDENMLKLEVEYGVVTVPMARVRRIEVDTPEKIEEREKRKAEALELAKKMKDEGMVLYKGKWITEEEKKAEEDKLAAAKKKKKEAELAAKKKADELAAKAKAAADLAAQQVANNTSNTRNDRFSRRHNRDDLNSDPLNNSNSNNYNNNSNNSNYNNNGNYSTILNQNGYRGGR